MSPRPTPAMFIFSLGATCPAPPRTWRGTIVRLAAALASVVAFSSRSRRVNGPVMGSPPRRTRCTVGQAWSPGSGNARRDERTNKRRPGGWDDDRRRVRVKEGGPATRRVAKQGDLGQHATCPPRAPQTTCTLEARRRGIKPLLPGVPSSAEARGRPSVSRCRRIHSR